MKRISFILAAFVLALCLTQCKKEKVLATTNDNIDNGVWITLNVGNNSRADVNPTGNANWATVSFEEGDTIYVGYNGAYVGCLKCTLANMETGSGHFEGTVNIETMVSGEKLHFYMLGGKGFQPDPASISNNQLSVNISDQSSKYPVISYAISNQDYVATTTAYTSDRLMNKCSIMKFNVTTNSTAPICITGMNNQVTLNFNPNTANTDDGFTYGQDGDGVITMHSATEGVGTTENPYQMWAIVLPQAALGAGSYGSAYTEDATESNCYLGSRTAIPTISSNQYIVSVNEEPISMTINIPKYVNLDGKSNQYTGINGQVLYNTESNSMTGNLYISSNATVTLRNVTIHGGIDACHQVGDICTIILEGVNHVDSQSYSTCAAVHTKDGTTMVIKGTGTLYATGGYKGAGIGAAFDAWSDEYGICGNFRIEGGIIYATGGYNCAGIGGMYQTSRPCGDITITGGEVHATGGTDAPGIGSGPGGECGNILIDGGTVEATGTGSYSAGIGTGRSGTCGNITITSNVTSVTAIKGGTSNSVKCIGKGSRTATCGTITIGGVVQSSGVGPNQTDNLTYIYPWP